MKNTTGKTFKAEKTAYDMYALIAIDMNDSREIVIGEFANRNTAENMAEMMNKAIISAWERA